MTRVSLKEAYDNKDVVAQIYAIRDIAEGAEDSADSAVTTANTASAHVDALVPQVEGAVQNANNASASAQASAQTVAGYENRLSAVEGETAGLDSDLGAVELRVTTAEGQIVTIQGRITALEGADAQNVKLAGPQSITGIKTVPTEPTGSLSQQIANSAKIGAELDNYSPMVRTTGNQPIDGLKTFQYPILKEFVVKDDATVSESTWRRLYTVTSSSSGSNRHVIITLPNTRSNAESRLTFMWGGLTGAPSCYIEHKISPIQVRVCRASNGNIEVWTNDHVYGYVVFEGIRTANTPTDIIEADVSANTTTEPVVGEDYLAVVTPTVIS